MRTSACEGAALGRIVFEANDFGVTAREVAVGGQLLSFRGLGGDYAEVFTRLKL